MINLYLRILVKKLGSAIDFSFIYPLVESLYSTLGRPSIDPVVLIKMTFVQYVFGIRLMRQTIKEIDTNMEYIAIKTILTFAAMNLKKLANWT